MATKKVKYVEPAGYIPKELRKKYGLGEYAETNADTKTETKKAPAKKGRNKEKVKIARGRAKALPFA